MLNNGTAGTSTAPESQPTLVDEIGAMFGDITGGESPEPDDDSAAGAPPASDGIAPDNAQASSEGQDDDALAGAPPADATDGPAPDQGTPADDDDPLAGSEPATYTVNGQQRTFDGLTKLGDKGGIISADAYPKLIQRLSERDNLFERQQQQHQRYTALEDAHNRLTQWNVKDQNGQTRTLTGAEAMEERNVLLARTLEAQRVLMSFLDDPQNFASLVTVVADAQGNPTIAVDPQGRKMLETLIDNAAIKGEQRVRSAMAQLRSTLPQTPTAPSGSSSASPGSIAPDVAARTVDNFAADMQVTNLTEADKKLLAASLPRFVRPIKPEERALFDPGTTMVVDAEFRELVQHTSNVRKEAAQSAASATTAGAENARRLAAAAAGQRKPGTNQPAKGKQPASSSSPRAPRSNAAKAWDLQNNLATGKLGTASEL